MLSTLLCITNPCESHCVRPCWPAGQHGRTQCDSQGFVMQSNVESIVNCGSLPLYANVGGKRLRCSKEQHRLINQVRPQIKEHAAARLGSLAPCPRTKLRTITLIVCFIEHQPSQNAGAYQLSHRLKISMPARILEDGKQATALSRKPHQLIGLLPVGGERLIHDYVAPRE